MKLVYSMPGVSGITGSETYSSSEGVRGRGGRGSGRGRTCEPLARLGTLEASELRAGPATLEASDRGTGLTRLDASEKSEKEPGRGVVVGRLAGTGAERVADSGCEREMRMDGGLRAVPEETVVDDDPAGSCENCTRDDERACDGRLREEGKARRTRR